MEQTDMILYGASGHGKVIKEIIEATGGTVEAFIDDNPAISELAGLMPKTDDIHPPKTGISVHFSDFFHPNGDAKLLIFSDSGHF